MGLALWTEVWPQTDGYDYQLQVDYLMLWSRAVDSFRHLAIKKGEEGEVVEESLEGGVFFFKLTVYSNRNVFHHPSLMKGSARGRTLPHLVCHSPSA